MRTRAEYLRRASDAYEKYMELQTEIDRIEKQALHESGGYKGPAAYQLKTGSRFADYRDLVADRDIQDKIVHINVAMAQIADLA